MKKKQILNVLCLGLFLIFPSSILPIEIAEIEKIIANRKDSDLSKIISLDKLFQADQNAENADLVLLEIAKIALKIKITNEEYLKNSQFRTIFKFRIVKSNNFGDFASYSGEHLTQLLNLFPKSEYIDDAEYYMLSVFPKSYNFTDLHQNRRDLQKFIKKYPASNMRIQAEKDIRWINDYLSKGNGPLID
ncbi:hypothetical protein [Leptospira johnsonii]|uniref:Outer membrane lipoprotein BamD-like domain-containing protein n=1 Tax=Leptospira johnsonii TaxID=1917820 RepID=A0A2P2D7Y0_9LEPT|nr:hypothetical protein [Leptospira johnsonii]GBF40730.1 hypothetical protein LPTSP1_37480 [Leptospira johnsonii]